MSPIELVGKVGVTQVQMVGGPHDGEQRWAVLGSPIVLMVQRPRRNDRERMGGMVFSFFGPPPEEYQQPKRKRYDTFAVYMPRFVDGKAAPMAWFEGAFRVEVPSAPVPTPNEEDEDA